MAVLSGPHLAETKALESAVLTAARMVLQKDRSWAERTEYLTG